MIETLMSWLPEENPTKKLLQDKIVPLLKRLGMAEWERDTVTDMAIRIGETGDSESLAIHEEAVVLADTDPTDAEPNTQV